MKIISNKKLEQIKQELTNYELDKSEWNETERNYLNQIKILNDKIKNIKKENDDNVNLLIKFDYDVKDFKQEIKRLKSLLTRNKINYKKTNKKEVE